MTAKRIDDNSDLRKVLPALLRAREEACRVATATGTALIYTEGGRIVREVVAKAPAADAAEGS